MTNNSIVPNKINLLKSLCEVSSPSGSEYLMKGFLLKYLEENQHNFKTKPVIINNQHTQDGMLWIFGDKPTTAIFAHQDIIGFTVRYDNKLVPIGTPSAELGYELVSVSDKPVHTKLVTMDDDYLSIDLNYTLAPGTELVFAPHFQVDGDWVTSPYLDNRMGIYNALRVAETLENGIIAFTCYEEHRGGNVASLARIIFEQYGVSQALISDITWHTEGVFAGNGPAISLRDSYIPRKLFLNKVIHLAVKSGIPYQLEVEGSGGSDGSELQRSPYPFDWCFIGVPIKEAHSPKETLHIDDLEKLVALYSYLMKKL